MPQYFSLVVNRKTFRQLSSHSYRNASHFSKLVRSTRNLLYSYLRPFGRRENFVPVYRIVFGQAKPIRFGDENTKLSTAELDELFGFEQGASHLESELKSKRSYHCIFISILVGQAIFRCSQESIKS